MQKKKLHSSKWLLDIKQRTASLKLTMLENIDKMEPNRDIHEYILHRT